MLAISIATVLAAVPLEEANAATAFCQRKVLRNFAKPLQEMPKLRHLSSNGVLPGSPRGLQVSPFNPLLNGPGSIGVVVEKRTQDGPQWDDWMIKVKLWQVSIEGIKVRKEGTRVANLSEPDDRRDLIFKVAQKPRFYRADIELWRKGSSTHGRYAEYFRVLNRTVDTKLRVERDRYRQGETAFIRLDNFGNVIMSYGELYTVELYNERGWTLVPELTGPSFAKLLGVGRGSSSACQRVPLIGNLLPGKYRITKELSVWPRSRTRILARAEFDLVSGP